MEHKEKIINEETGIIDYGVFKLKSRKYFKNKKSKVKYLVQNIIPERSILMVYSPPKNLKTIFCRDIGICLTRGLYFLHRFKSQRCGVLYIDFENADEKNEETTSRLEKNYNIRKSNVYYISREKIDILDKNCQEGIKKVIKDNNIKLIIIDTMAKSTRYNPRLEEEINHIYLDFFMPFVEEENVSILFLLHTTKDETTFLGGQSYFGNVDCSLRFKPLKKETIENEEEIKSIIEVGILPDNRGSNTALGYGAEIIEKKIKPKTKRRRNVKPDVELEPERELQSIKTYYFKVDYEELKKKPRDKSDLGVQKRITNEIVLILDEEKKLQRKDIIDKLSSLGYGKEKEATVGRALEWLLKSKMTSKESYGIYELTNKGKTRAENIKSGKT